MPSSRLHFQWAPFTLAVIAAFSLTGCSLVKGIFKAGMGVGIIAVVLLVALVGGAVAMMRR